MNKTKKLQFLESGTAKDTGCTFGKGYFIGFIFILTFIFTDKNTPFFYTYVYNVEIAPTLWALINILSYAPTNIHSDFL